MASLSNFVVYKSSAGSGKTYTLVKEYLKIILQNPLKVRNILAITFTNAASAEMKERILHTLGALEKLQGLAPEEIPAGLGQLLDDLARETGLPQTLLLRNAASALNQILHNYADFSVSTIDSFVHRVIRSFAFDLRLPLNFEIELDTPRMLSQAVDLLISRAGEQETLTQLLIEFIESRSDEEKSQHIEFEIIQIAKNLLAEGGELYLEYLRGLELSDFSDIRKRLRESIQAFEQRVSQIAQKALQALKEEQLGMEDFFQGKNGIIKWFQVQSQIRIAQVKLPGANVLNTIENGKWAAGKATAQKKAAIDKLVPLLRSCYDDIMHCFAHELGRYREFSLILANLYPLALLCELDKVLEEIKAEESVLHISDFNKKIARIVAEEPAPFIYERIGERYMHYMIDEFQDTSLLQWQNLLPLVDNALASAHTNLVVGDGKQAIYRWRGGEVEQFAQLPGIPQAIKGSAKGQWEQSLQRHYQEKNLDTNYRSHQEIVGFNNAFFDYAAPFLAEKLQSIYRMQAQKAMAQKPGGYVQLQFVSEDKEAGLKFNEACREEMLKIIHDLRKDHPLQDITILCRANDDAIDTARFLLEHQINVIATESLLLSQSARVNFILSILQLLHNPADQIAMTGFVAFLCKGPLLPLQVDLHQSLRAIRQDPHISRSCLPQLEQWLQQYGIDFAFEPCYHLGLYELGEHIYRHFFHEQDKVDPFLTFFMDVLFEYANSHPASPSEFLEWWEVNHAKYSVVVPEGVDAIQIMTIHKAKGLQFPIVIYPYADTGMAELKQAGTWIQFDYPEAYPLKVAWVKLNKIMLDTEWREVYEAESQKVFLDNLNLAYVALTRAVSQLYVLTQHNEGNSGDSSRLSGLFKGFLSQQGIWQDDVRVYEYGQRATPTAGRVDATPAEAGFLKFTSSPWGKRILVKSRQAERSLQPEANPESLRGTWVHAILSKVRVATDLQTVLEQHVMAGDIDRLEMQELHEKISQVIQHPLVMPWYEPGLQVKTECAMYNSQGMFLRADRVVIGPDGTLAVFDYKTGNAYDWHKTQIQAYAAVLSEMGYGPVSRFLLYLDQAKVELV